MFIYKTVLLHNVIKMFNYMTIAFLSTYKIRQETGRFSPT